MSESREETFRRLYADHSDVVLGYAPTRTDRPEDAVRCVHCHHGAGHGVRE